jgi:transposase
VGLAARPSHHRLEALLERCRERKRLRAHGRQRTDSTPVLGAIRAVHRSVGVADTMRHALNRVAVAAPEWLQAHRRPEWLERDGARAHDERLPKGEPPRLAYAHAVGLDG